MSVVVVGDKSELISISRFLFPNKDDKDDEDEDEDEEDELIFAFICCFFFN